MEDIRCGVTVAALRNFLKYTIKLIHAADSKKVQQYLDSAFYFTRYVYLTEVNNGNYISEDHITWWGESAPFIFSCPLYNRRGLDKLGTLFINFPEIFSGETLLLVEGESEKIFIETLIYNHDIDVLVYRGKGNRPPKKLNVLIDDSKQKGYKVSMLYDGDGSHNPAYVDMTKNLIPKNRCFQFKYDFETSFPPKLIYYVLHELKLIDNIEMDDFLDLIPYPPEESLQETLKKIDIDLENIKIKFAEKAAYVINNSEFFHESTFKENELWIFLQFIHNGCKHNYFED